MMHKKQRVIGPSQEMITDFSETSMWDWVVFLSFRGPDTRYKFTDYLYHNLKNKHIRVFRDAEGLRTGDEISLSLVKAIERSRLSVVIFSKDYASSNSCLDELVTILRCKEERKQRVIPIFYEVDPSEVRYQKMDVHKQKYGKDRVQNWTSALEEASKLKGESYLAGYEYEFLQKIVKQIISFLGPPRLYVVENPVGLGSRISEFILLSESVCPDQNDVQMLGIYGIAGIGKTTFAKAFYNLVAVQFESASFVEVGGKASTIDGLVRLQGVMEMQLRLQNKKILLILDDVDELVQLKKLAGDRNWFGPGSRVIITTRHQDLLRQHGVNNERTYELKPLDHQEALELFFWHAFKRSEPVADYADISSDLTDYAQGLPLALEVIGADVCGKEKDEWESTLADHKSIMSDDIFTRLKVSYNKLRYNVKQMLLDMACFFNGESWDYLENIFEGCNFNPKVGMGVLKEKCFIRRQDGKVWMHNLVRDMGREIVRQESEAEPGKRSRLWHCEDVLRVLATRDLGTSAIQGLMLDLPERSMVDWNNNCLEKMINLRILIMRNARFSTPPEQLPNSVIVLNWEEYPSSSFPSDFMGNKLLDLRLGNSSHPLQLHYPLKMFGNMKYLHITHIEQVTNLPDLSWAVNLLEIHLDFCCNLVELDHDKGRIQLPMLQVFSAMGCSKLQKCPRICSPVLKTINLSGCRQLESVPPMPSIALQEIYLQGSGKDIARSFYKNKEKNCPVVFVPGDSIPTFFQYCQDGNSLSFSVRRRVPTICVGFALEAVKFNSKLSYQISLSLGGSLQLVRKGDFTQHSCRVFFCNLTNALTEEERILEDNWVKAEVTGIVTFSGPSERLHRDATPVVIKVCGVYVDWLGSDEKDFLCSAISSRDFSDIASLHDSKAQSLLNLSTVRYGNNFVRFCELDYSPSYGNYWKKDLLCFGIDTGASNSDDDDDKYCDSGNRDRRSAVLHDSIDDDVDDDTNYRDRAALEDSDDDNCDKSSGDSANYERGAASHDCIDDEVDDNDTYQDKALLYNSDEDTEDNDSDSDSDYPPLVELPMMGWVKLTTAGSRNGHDGGIAVGDWTGRWFVGFPVRVINAELVGIKHGLEWARDRGLQNVIVESDSKEMIHWLGHGVGSDHPSSSLVRECRQLLRAANEVHLKHILVKQAMAVLTRMAMESDHPYGLSLW